MPGSDFQISTDGQRLFDRFRTNRNGDSEKVNNTNSGKSLSRSYFQGASTRNSLFGEDELVEFEDESLSAEDETNSRTSSKGEYDDKTSETEESSGKKAHKGGKHHGKHGPKGSGDESSDKVSGKEHSHRGEKPSKKPDRKPGGDKVPPEFANGNNSKAQNENQIKEEDDD